MKQLDAHDGVTARVDAICQTTRTEDTSCPFAIQLPSLFLAAHYSRIVRLGAPALAEACKSFNDGVP